MKMTKKLIFTCAMVAIMTSLFAQSNSQLSIQGVLRNANGTAVENGQYDIVFRLWDAPTNGTQIWEEEILQVDVEGGIYSVVLGQASTPLDASFTEQYYLGVSIEGGTELIPRAPLTSSPYALSLIGSDNVFPNSGNVGVGSPTPQNRLTIQRGDGILGLEAIEDANNTSTITTTAEGISFDAGGTDKVYAFPNGRIDATADEQFTIEETDDANLVFTKTSGSATLGFDATNGDELKLTNSIGDTHIEGSNISLITTNGTATIEGNTTINGNTAIDGIVEVTKEGEALQLTGTTNTQLAFYPTGIAGGKKADIDVASNGQLSINSTDSDITLTPGSGYRTQTNGLFYANSYKLTNVPQGNHIHERYVSSGYAIRRNSTNYNLSIYATHGVRAHEFVIASDKRIKKDFSLSDGQEDLLTLSKIEVTDYRHIDAPSQGKETKKGVIAQQVNTVFPEAISRGTDFIPNVFEMPIALSLENGSLNVRLSKNHDFELGNKIRVGTTKGDQEVLVSSIISPQEFSIDNWQGSANKDELFVYGKEVDDFNTVDYDRIFTLNVSATQELARQVEALQRENAVLKATVTNTEKANVALKSEVKDMNKRLQAIELMMTATGQK